MSRDPDLHHAISLRPVPFNYGGQARGSQATSDRPSLSPAPTNTVSAMDAKAASSAYEPATVEAHSEHATARNAYTRSSSDFESEDVEGRPTTTFDADSDPYNLSRGMQTSEQIEVMRANISRKRSKTSFAPLVKGGDALRARRLQHFYQSQNDNITRMLKPVDEHRRQAREEIGADHLKFKIAVQGSFIANLILAALQVYGAVSSGSLSLFTTMADAIFDPLSNITLILSARAVNHVDPRRFPSGKARIETTGNIVFCFLMTSVSFILIVMSARQLAEGSEAAIGTLHLPSVIAVAVAFLTKLALFLYCWALRNKYSQIRILWEDHRNDLFINGFGLLTSVGGSKLRWWIDPMGAIILSVLIAFLWLRTAYFEFQLLIGVSADTHMLQLITYISMTHDERIVGIDTVRAYHSGPRLIVEVDIVMSAKQTLKDTHDVAEGLQTKLESLPDVERCFVHVDYETSHAPEHFTKKEI